MAQAIKRPTSALHEASGSPPTLAFDYDEVAEEFPRLAEKVREYGPIDKLSIHGLSEQTTRMLYGAYQSGLGRIALFDRATGETKGNPDYFKNREPIDANMALFHLIGRIIAEAGLQGFMHPGVGQSRNKPKLRPGLAHMAQLIKGFDREVWHRALDTIDECYYFINDLKRRQPQVSSHLIPADQVRRDPP